MPRRTLPNLRRSKVISGNTMPPRNPPNKKLLQKNIITSSKSIPMPQHDLILPRMTLGTSALHTQPGIIQSNPQITKQRHQPLGPTKSVVDTMRGKRPVSIPKNDLVLDPHGRNQPQPLQSRQLPPQHLTRSKLGSSP